MLVGVTGAVPVTGTTTIAANLAVVLAREGRRVLVAELSGGTDMLSALGLAEKAREGMYADIAGWEYGQLLTTGYGLTVLPGSERVKHVDGRKVACIIDSFTSAFEFIVLDLGHLRKPGVSELAARLEKVILVTEPSQRCMIRRELIPESFILLVNRVTKGVYHPRDMARYYGVDRWLEVSDDPKAVRKSVARQQPLVLCGKRIDAEMRRVALAVLDENVPEKTVGEVAVRDAGHRSGRKSPGLARIIHLLKKPRGEAGPGEEPPERVQIVRDGDWVENPVPAVEVPPDLAVFGSLPGARCCETVQCEVAEEPRPRVKQEEIAALPKPSVSNPKESTSDLPPGRILLHSPKLRIGQILSRITPKSKEELPNLICVWSPAPAGKTFTAVNLAAAYALKGYRTVLVSRDAISHSGEMPGLTVLDKGEYRRLAEEFEVVVVDGYRDALRCAGQIMLVVNVTYLDAISESLDREELDWNKVWVVANGVPGEEIGRVEAALQLKVDYVVPYTEGRPATTLPGPGLAEVFRSAAVI